MSDLRDELEALRVDPSSDLRFDRIRGRALVEGRPEYLAEAWSLRAEALFSADRIDAAADAWIESAATWVEELRRPGEAEPALRRALEARPHDRQALHALALFLHRRSAWLELVDHYRTWLRQADGAEQAELHFYISEVLEEHLNDPGGAFDEVAKAVAHAPQDPTWIVELTHLAERTRRHEDLAFVIGDLMLSTDDPEVRAALDVRLAQLYLGPLSDARRALVCLRSALYEIGEDPDSIPDLESAAAIGPQLDRFEEKLSQGVNSIRSTPQPVRLERRLAGIYEHELQDHRRALLALTRALRHRPDDRELQEEVMRLGLIADDLDRVARTFERVVAETDNGLLKSFLRLRLGHLYGQALMRPQEAVRVYFELLEDEPRQPEAQRRLEPLLERLGRRREQVELLEAALSDAVGSDRLRILEKLERLYAMLGREADVLRVEQTRLEETGERRAPELLSGDDAMRPSEPAAAIVSGFHQQPRIQQLQAGLDSPDGEVARRAHVELTRILIDEREDYEQAEAVAEAGLDRFPREAVLLELLEDVHRRQQRWDSVVTILRRRLDASESVEGRLAVRKALARLFEAKMDDKARALEVLSQAEEEGPFDLEVSRERERLQLERLDWMPVKRTLERRMAQLEDPRLVALTAASLARLAYEVDLDLERAWFLLRDALLEASDEPEVLELAADVAFRRKEFEQAAELYERLAAHQEGPAAAHAFVAAGRTARDQLDDRDRAEAAFEAALASDAACEPAVEALCRLKSERGDWVQALTWLVRSAQLASDVSTRAQRLTEAGHLAETRLGDDQKAAVLYESALDVDPDQTDLYVRVASLLEPREPGRAALRYLEAADRALLSADAADWRERAGVLLERVRDPGGAIEAYRGALSSEPHRRRSLERLAALLEERSVWDEVYDLSATLVLWHESTLSAADRADIYLRMAKAKRALGDWSSALRLVERSIEIEESADALALWAEGLEEDERWFEAAEALRRLALRTEREDDRVRALSRSGFLFGERAEDPARAAVVLAEAVGHRPVDAELCERLALYRHRSGDDVAAAEALRSRAMQLHGAARAEALRRAATWARSQNRWLSYDLLRAAIEVEPTPRAVRDLAELLEYDGDAELVPELFVDLGRSEARSGRFESAARAFRSAAEIGAFRAFDPAAVDTACDALRGLEPGANWSLLQALVADDGTGDSPESAMEAAKAWLDVLETCPGHVPAMERVEHWLRAAGRESAAALVRSIRTDALQTPPLLDVPAVPFRGLPEPTDGISSALACHGIAMLERARDGWHKHTVSRRALVLDELPDGLSSAFTAMKHRWDAPDVQMYELDGAAHPTEAVFLDGQPGVAVDLAWCTALSPEDLGFHLGRAFASLRPDVLVLSVFEPLALIETVAGLSPTAPEALGLDVKRARRRARALERLDDEARVDLLRVADEVPSTWRTTLDAARINTQCGGLVGSLSWSVVRRQVDAEASPSRRRIWPGIVRFAAGKAFLGWACRLVMAAP